jgi:hypothetical protein
MSKETEKLKAMVDGDGDILITTTEKEYKFTCKSNRWTDLLLAEKGTNILSLIQGGLDSATNSDLEDGYAIIAAMSRNASPEGKITCPVDVVREYMNTFTLRGCWIVALARYTEMLEEAGQLAADSKKKAVG